MNSWREERTFNDWQRNGYGTHTQGLFGQVHFSGKGDWCSLKLIGDSLSCIKIQVKFAQSLWVDR